jgi:hypothetical protein
MFMNNRFPFLTLIYVLLIFGCSESSADKHRKELALFNSIVAISELYKNDSGVYPSSVIQIIDRFPETADSNNEEILRRTVFHTGERENKLEMHGETGVFIYDFDYSKGRFSPKR